MSATSSPIPAATDASSHVAVPPPAGDVVVGAGATVVGAGAAVVGAGAAVVGAGATVVTTGASVLGTGAAVVTGDSVVLGRWRVDVLRADARAVQLLRVEARADDAPDETR